VKAFWTDEGWVMALPKLATAVQTGAMRHLVITGGTGGLGRALAAAFAGPDWAVAAPGSGELDVRDGAAVSRYFADRPVDLLVCAAGLTGEGLLAKLPEGVWDEVMAVNFEGAADCARAALPGMIARGGGHLVFVASGAALHPPAGLAAYASAKAALLGLARDLAARHGRDGVRVNTILPGFLETRMTREVTAPRRAAVRAEHALGTFNTPQAAARFVRFLQEQMPHTSGQVFQLDSRVG
jgi:3-oxoacyl-[acyl-carrier protein] reductase